MSQEKWQVGPWVDLKSFFPSRFNLLHSLSCQVVLLHTERLYQVPLFTLLLVYLSPHHLSTFNLVCPDVLVYPVQLEIIMQLTNVLSQGIIRKTITRAYRGSGCGWMGCGWMGVVGRVCLDCVLGRCAMAWVVGFTQIPEISQFSNIKKKILVFSVRTIC